MNSNFVIFMLIIIIIILYCLLRDCYSKQAQSIRTCNKMKISPAKFNPAIHHPAML